MKKIVESFDGIANGLNSLSNYDNHRLAHLCSISYSGYYYYLRANLNFLSLDELIQLANKGALCVLLALDIYLGRSEIKQSEGYNNELIYFPTDIFYTLLFMAQNEENFTKFASGYIERDHTIRHKRGKTIYDYPELFLALSYYILGDLVKCKEHLSRAMDAKKPAGMLKGYHQMISGILEKDIDLIKQGIEAHLKWFKRDRESRESVGFPYCFEVMGFINFARFKGINIEIESPNIHPDLIKPLPENFVFEGIPEVYKAIQTADNKNNGIIGRLKNLFN